MRNSKLKIQATIIILLILSLFIGIKSCKEYYKKPENRYRKVLYCNIDSCKKMIKPNIEAVRDDLIYYKIKYPDIVLQQAIWETGWFKSKACRVNNNLFGFTYDGKNYLKFNTWQESVRYYKQWQDKKYKGGDYYQFLIDLPYSGDSLYKSHLESINVNKREL